MNMPQIGTRLALKALGVELNLSTFDGRLSVQKAIYLAKAAGLDCGHYFSWYLRGPYSAELTKDAFSIAAEIAGGEDESTGWKLDDQIAGKLREIGQLIPSGDTSAAARKLELLASVHFLVDRLQVANADPESIVKVLRRYDKDFSEREVETALEELRTHGLFSR